ncbi:hydantoinase/oxoprolinase family protein [Pseudonocardia asaccharolytica]|uniref:Methylhydantoinase n=1 Tax=Pseudonocardia asaccharolytica DSM 44247 = NBRC 16224 TaxID=1123024 RepID=A0A511D371_9PSEU|nr:hydantoinase/oxoprolinase family protein [Pseudonocardia asaccharolytica]GEL19232.1 methylhydantoinase [Pseudonocardia asaccharolytica DSM 44247 = NBRC 16224]
MDHLINIDNGGTLTDICVWDGTDFTFTKTLTTPFDLSQCLFDGIAKVSENVFGGRDLERLLHRTRHIRYSTTQGTNALVERKGPSLGLIVDDASVVADLRATEQERGLFDDLVGLRVAVVDPGTGDEELSAQLVAQVNKLTTDGAARIVVAVGDADGEAERRVRGILLRCFPRHLLGSVPFLYSWEFATDRVPARRIWSGLLNSFLHPVMERFLYNAEDRLRRHRVRNPLLIYRNDGASSRVAKSVALKTYSSGPRGGLEGTRALATAYGLEHVLMVDVGGTTTDVGSVKQARIATDRRGAVEGVRISFPMSDVHSSGIGGSSIIQVRDGDIQVGPESVGAAPGPACFGFGGTSATITDVNLLLGVLDPATYLDGDFALDAERSRAVITETVAEPLGIGLDEALVRMEAAYFARMAESFGALVEESTTLAAFGGAGPMSACGAARLTGVRRVLIPRLAAVFSAFGIGFSDIGRTYEVTLTTPSADAAVDAHDALADRAERDMFQEGYELVGCRPEWTLVTEDGDGAVVAETPYRPGDVPTVGSGEHAVLRLAVTAELPHGTVPTAAQPPASPAVPSGNRKVRSGATQVGDVPVYPLAEQRPGAIAAGPAIVEGPFFTTRVLDGWTFEVTAGGDLLLTDITSTPA